MKTIYFIRHGETELNRLRIIQGSGVDSSLNDTGRTQGQAFYAQYKDLPFEVVLTSLLKRTHETVASFLETGLAWEQFGEINEMSWGIYEGKSGTPTMRDEYARLNASWKSGDYDARMPEGESARELGERVTAFIEILKKRPENCLLVCAHGRLMRCLMCLLAERPLAEMQAYSHSNTGLYKVQYDGEKFHFLLKNDTSHLV